MIEDQLKIGRKQEVIVVLLLLLLILTVRLYQLGADPPFGLSISSDVYTDPAQYTYFAKQYINDGDFNPFGEFRYTFFLKSSVTAVAVGVFKLFGVGLWQSNFVGFLYSFGALLLFFFFVRRWAGSIAAILYLLLVSLNYNQIFYGRLPFLEHAMIFWAFLALVLVSYARGVLLTLLAGCSLAIGIFFGKVIGIVFLFPFACFFAYRFFFESEHTGAIANRLKQPVVFAVGFLAIMLSWLFTVYLPVQKEVAGYIGEKSVALYGSPEAFDSFYNFLFKFVSFGYKQGLFPRMAVVALLALALLLIFFYHLVRKQSWKSGFGQLNSGLIFIATALLSFYGALMIWNYRPLRYQLVLIYLAAGAAAYVMTLLWRQWQKPQRVKTPFLFYLLATPFLGSLFYQIARSVSRQIGGGFNYEDYWYLVILAGAIMALTIGLAISMYRKGEIGIKPLLGKVVVVIAIFAALGEGTAEYIYWQQRPTFTIRDNSRDLATILAPGAVVSGPFGPTLTIDSKVKSIIHMFGVSEVDPDLFKRFPITHLLMDEANESQARDQYPKIMDSSVLICSYHIGYKKARLYRIAGLTGNPAADRYRGSLFEVAHFYSGDDSSGQSERALSHFLRLHPENIYGNLLVAELAEKAENYDRAETFFKKAVEFSPTNYDLVARLAKFYGDRFEAEGDPVMKRKGVATYDQAVKYAPTIQKIADARRKLETSIGPVMKR